MTSATDNPIAAVEVEQSILGAIQRDGTLFDQAQEVLSEADFFLPSHRRLFRLMGEMASAGDEITHEGVINAIIGSHLDAQIGLAYAMEMHDRSMRRKSITHWLEQVREKAMLRKAADLAESLMQRACSQEEPADELIAAADRGFLEIAAQSSSAFLSLDEQCARAVDVLERQRSGEEATTYPYGLEALDHFLGGMGVGEMTVLGGRPGMGKSAIVAQTVLANCWAGRACHVFSIEMTSTQLLHRLYAAVSGVPFVKVRYAKQMSREEMERVKSASVRIAGLPLVIDDCSRLTSDQVIAKARVVKRRINTAICAVDYLQKLRFPKGDKQFQAVTEAAVSFASFAKEERVAMLVLSSLTTKNGKHRNDPPTLSDLRQSGDIEYEAHNAILLHRVVDEETQFTHLQSAFIVAKARNDSTGGVTAYFNPNSLLFEDRPHV